MTKLAGTIHTSANVEGKGIIVRKSVLDMSIVSYVASHLEGGQALGYAALTAIFRRKPQHFVNIEVTPDEKMLVDQIFATYQTASGASCHFRMKATIDALRV